MNTNALNLIHRELDDENSAEDSRRLQNLLREQPDLQRVFDELSEVDATLKASDAVEPPVWLKRSIMDALPERGSSRSVFAGLKELIGTLWQPVHARPALAYAYTFAIGLAVGLAVFAIALKDAPATEEHLYGTLADRDALARLEPSGRVDIQLPEVAGTAELMSSRDLFTIELLMQSDEPVELRLVPDPALELRGITRTSDSPSDMRVDADAVQVEIEGAQSYTVLFDRVDAGSAGVRLQIYRDGRLLHEELLQGG